MLNLIIISLIFPFLPVFLYGQAIKSLGADFSSSFQKMTDKPEVLSESSKRNTGFESCNAFPIDSSGGSFQFAPVRKGTYQDLKIWAGSSVALDVDSGTILHYEEGRKRMQVASLTKMMTAVLVMENIKNLNEEVAITAEALNVPGTVVGCPTSVYCPSNRMYKGEKVKAHDLLKAMLLNSANDAAAALAIYIAGSEKKFVEMMNKKTGNLGLKDTHFCTASGLETDGRETECYSSAYDIARIAADSLKYQEIWDIMRIEEGRFYSTNGKYMHELKNTDLLLNSLPNCLGGKTGFTPLAGKSLLLGSSDPTGKHRIIAVVLNDDKRWEDMKTLINWVFNNYEWR